MSTFEEFYPALQDTVAQVAYEYGGKGRRYGADHSDFQQEFICWLIEHERGIAEWLEELGHEQTVKLVARSLQNEGKDYLLDIKAQATGYERHDLYFYSRAELKELLGAMYDKDKWLEPPQSEGRSTKAPAEGGNWIATLADVARAVSQLSEDDQRLLEGFHRDGWNNKMMAEAEQISEANMSYRHNQALKRLNALVGGEAPKPMREQTTRDPWRGRHAVSNSAARAYQSAVYERD